MIITTINQSKKGKKIEGNEQNDWKVHVKVRSGKWVVWASVPRSEYNHQLAGGCQIDGFE